MGRKRWIGIIAISVFSFCMATPAPAYDLRAVAEDMDNYFIPAFPPAYGELINRLPPETVGDIPKVLKALEIFGYLKTLGDAANKLDAGDKTGAALDIAMGAATLAINLLKDEATNKVIVAGVGISTIPLTGLLTTIEITRKSIDAVRASKTALELERLHYGILTDPVLKVKGRKLGEGDPIRIDATTIEHLWRRVLFDDTWRTLFKTYVTTELNQAWPEPSLWETLTLKSDNLDEAMLLEEARRLKGHIRALLGEINKVAKADEARVLLAQELKAISAQAGRLSPQELEKALAAHGNALRQLPSIDAYVKGLPDRIQDFKARMQKATAEELVRIREQEIMGELGTITSHAATIRGLSPGGQYGATRDDILKKLRDGYRSLASLRTAAGRAEVNARLVAESKKLETAGTEFVFKRHACEKVFEDVQEAFAAQVVRGEAGAADAVARAKAEIQKNLDDLINAYRRDKAEQDKKYEEKKAEIEREISRLNEQLKRTSDTRQREELYRALDRLRSELTAMTGRYEAYVKLFNMNFSTDQGSCMGALREIDTFVRENMNRQGIVQGRIEAAFSDADVKYQQLHMNTSQISRRFLSAEELAQVEQVLQEAVDPYAGLSFEFLKRHLKNDPSVPRAKNVLDTLTQMSGALRTYFESLRRYHMTWYADWEKRTIPSLKFMGSAEARDSVQVVLDAIDSALSILRQTDPADFPATFRQRYDAMLDELQRKRGEMQALRSRLSRSVGLGDRLQAYAERALKNNSRIAEDSPQVLTVYRAFLRASQSMQFLYARFLAESQADPKRTLDSGQISAILEESRVLFWSKTLDLGIAEALLKEPFVTIRTGEGPVDILVEHIRAARDRVGQAPVNDYALFFRFVRDAGGIPGLLIELLLTASMDFPKLFQANESLAREANALYALLNERRDLAFRNQQLVHELNARFDIVLRKAHQLLEAMKARYEGKEFQSVANYEMFLGEVRAQYSAIGKTRNDVDQVFAAIDALIAEAKRQLSQAAIAQAQLIKDFYNRFKQAYESRNDSLVMSFIGDEWSAGDGTTLSDLRLNLSRSFRTFDEIRYHIQNLNVTPSSEGKFIVSYDLTISSRIFRRNIKHEEKSTVNEEVMLDRSGKVKITRTLNGRFWYTQ